MGYSNKTAEIYYVNTVFHFLLRADVFHKAMFAFKGAL